MDGNGPEWPGNDRKWSEIARVGWESLGMAGNGWEWTGMSRNDWKLLRMMGMVRNNQGWPAGNRWEWPGKAVNVWK